MIVHQRKAAHVPCSRRSLAHARPARRRRSPLPEVASRAASSRLCALCCGVTAASSAQAAAGPQGRGGRATGAQYVLRAEAAARPLLVERQPKGFSHRRRTRELAGPRCSHRRCRRRRRRRLLPATGTLAHAPLTHTCFFQPPAPQGRPEWVGTKLAKVVQLVCSFLRDVTAQQALGQDAAGRDVVRLAAMPKTAFAHTHVGAGTGWDGCLTSALAQQQ